MEKKHTYIERELLAIIFTYQWFNTCVLGRPFMTQSEHKPTEMIHLKHLANTPEKLQTMLFQFQKYNLPIQYRPCRELLLAVVLNHCPSRTSLKIKLHLTVDYVAFNTAWIKKVKNNRIQSQQQCTSAASRYIHTLNGMAL